MAKHIHIHFAPRKRIGDQAPGSVPPSNLTPLVEALHAAIAARQGAAPTKDAEQARASNGQFAAVPSSSAKHAPLHKQTHERILAGQPARNQAEADRYRQHRAHNAKHLTEAHVKAHPAYSEASVAESRKLGFSTLGVIQRLDDDHRRRATKDADFDESKHKRDADGRFSAQQHEAAAAEHKAEAEKHDAAYKATNDPQHALARNAHQEAGVHHGVAARHVQAQTGWSAHNAQQAHNATALAKQMSAKTAGSGSLEQLKATASDPNASIEQRAAAVAQLSKMEKLANAVAGSPHAIPPPASTFEQQLEARGREVALAHYQQAGDKAPSYLSASMDNGTPSDMLGSKLLKHPSISRLADQGDEALYDHADKVYAHAQKHLKTLMAAKK